jgi:6-phosphogluconolactonase
VYSYEYNPNASAALVKDSFAVESGSGPRHLTFSKMGSMFILLQELTGGLTVFVIRKES